MRKVLTTAINQSLHEALTQQEYHCREGFCGTCRCKLIEGKVSYKDEPIAMANAGEIFPCIAKAESEKIIVEI